MIAGPPSVLSTTPRDMDGRKELWTVGVDWKEAHLSLDGNLEAQITIYSHQHGTVTDPSH